MAGQFSPKKTQQTKSRLRPQSEVGCKERRFFMSLTTIAARFTDEPSNSTMLEERRILTTLKMIYEGGSLTARPPISPPATSPASWLAGTGVIGISLRLTSARSGSIFAMGEQSFAAPGSLLNHNNSSWWKRLLAVLCFRKPKAIVI